MAGTVREGLDVPEVQRGALMRHEARRVQQAQRGVALEEQVLQVRHEARLGGTGAAGVTEAGTGARTAEALQAQQSGEQVPQMQVQRLGEQEPGVRRQSRVFFATDENMQAVNDFIHSQIPAECPPQVLNQIDLAVEEVFINIAHYAYAPQSGTVEIICALTEPGELAVTFKDGGRPYNPLAREDPDITLSAEERGIGGLGVFLTKQFMDGVEYSYAEKQNVLTVRKNVRGGQ